MPVIFPVKKKKKEVGASILHGIACEKEKLNSGSMFELAPSHKFGAKTGRL
jgi:hypothetical protein